MKNLKEQETLKNLMSAFAGESQARTDTYSTPRLRVKKANRLDHFHRNCCQ